MAHWTQELKEENERLKAALEIAKTALVQVPLSRWDKYAGAGWDDSTIAYRKAVEEVRRLNDAALSQVHDVIVGGVPVSVVVRGPENSR